MAVNLSTNLREAYEHFILRDLTYFFSGLLILLIFNFSFKTNILNEIIKLLEFEEVIWFKFILVFIVAYFVGLIFKEGLMSDHISKSTKCWICKWFRKYWFSTNPYNQSTYDKINANQLYSSKYGEYSNFRLMNNIEECYGYSTTKRLIRVVYFMHIGASIGAASVISIFILFSNLILKFLGRIDAAHSIEINGTFLIILVSMFIIFVICWKENRWKIEQYRKFLIDLGVNL